MLAFFAEQVGGKPKVNLLLAWCTKHFARGRSLRRKPCCALLLWMTMCFICCGGAYALQRLSLPQPPPRGQRRIATAMHFYRVILNVVSETNEMRDLGILCCHPEALAEGSRPVILGTIGAALLRCSFEILHSILVRSG